MKDRLDQLYFLPPTIATPWHGMPLQSTGVPVPRRAKSEITIDVPLFWYDPPWHEESPEKADHIATAVANLGVIVSALKTDLSADDHEPIFYGHDQDHHADDAPETSVEHEVYSRMLPYRPERYGLHAEDFDGPKIIDVRMMTARDSSGRFAYSPEQIARWESTPEDQPLAGGGWVPAATFPPDVVSAEHLARKLDQLRQLSPEAAIFVSIGPYRMETEVAAALTAKPDGVIIRFDEIQLESIQLAALTRRARLLIDKVDKDLSLWIVPGKVTADDAVKLVALGATAVAIDSWCNPLLDLDIEPQVAATSRYGQKPAALDQEYISELVDDEIQSLIGRFKGLYLSLQQLPKDQQLGSFSLAWSKALGVQALR